MIYKKNTYTLTIIEFSFSAALKKFKGLQNTQSFLLSSIANTFIIYTVTLKLFTFVFRKERLSHKKFCPRAKPLTRQISLRTYIRVLSKIRYHPFSKGARAVELGGLVAQGA